jgi:PAS domain S-box-containing protein
MVEPSVTPPMVEQLQEQLDAVRCQLSRAQQMFAEEHERRKRTERDLRDSEAVYHSLVENLPVSLIRKDLEGRFTFVNRPISQEFGLSLSDIIGKTDFHFFPEELAAKYRADDRRVIETRQVFDDIEVHRAPNGDYRYVHVIKAPVVDSHGQVVGVQLVFWDETNRKRAEEELKSSEARKRAIFETSLDCLIISDENGKIVEFNRSAEQTFGYSREEALGRDMDDLLFAPSTRGYSRESLARYRLSDDEGSLLGKRLEVPLVRRNGEGFIAEMAMQPIPLEGTVHFATVLHDITSRKQAEVDLQKAKEAAEAANRAKSAFLANMSHEIRTPMNAILGMTGLVLDTGLTTEQREHLLIVQDSAESLLSLINDILDFSKIEAGRLDLHADPFRLRDRIGDTMKSLSIRAHDKHLELACLIAPDVPDHLLGDIGRLRQVVINLVGNAVKFTEHGEVLLEVSVEEDAPADVLLMFTIHDTGIGIPKSRQSAIFDAFEQVDTSTTRRYGGTGLGLAISSRLVELMGGQIWVESEVGHGSTFHFTARFGKAPPADEQEQQKVLSTLRGLAVLVVDDNATNRRILKEMLNNWEMRPTLASGTDEALRMLRRSRGSQPIQLVLTDANMPDRDGFALIEQIREDPDLEGLPVLLLTSGDRPGDLDRCMALRVSRYMTKPVKQSELLDAIGASFLVQPQLAVRMSPAEQLLGHCRGLRILLAEDSIPNQKLAIGLLKKMDHEVTIASDGVEALKCWKSQIFDVILMDVQMPHMDGLETTRLIRMREQPLERHTPIVAMTAHAMRGDEERCLEAGMDAYVAKPIRPDELFRAIDRVCQVGGDDRQTAVSEPGQVPMASVDIDWNAALTLVQGDHELLAEVVEAVLEELPQLMTQLDIALTAADARAVQRLAHTVKGNLRTFRVGPVIDIAEELELDAQHGLSFHAPEIRDRLRLGTEAFLIALRANSRHG